MKRENKQGNKLFATILAGENIDRDTASRMPWILSPITVLAGSGITAMCVLVGECLPDLRSSLISHSPGRDHGPP